MKRIKLQIKKSKNSKNCIKENYYIFKYIVSFLQNYAKIELLNTWCSCVKICQALGRTQIVFA